MRDSAIDRTWLDEFSNQSFLISGGAGFLGHATIEKLCEILPQSAKINICWRISRPHLTDDRISLHQTSFKEGDFPSEIACNADYIIWIAADRSHDSSIATLWENNVHTVLRLIKSLRRRSKIRRLIYVSSISAVDQIANSTRRINDSTTPNPTTNYGVTKLAAETLLASSEIPYTILRLPFLYGPKFRPKSFLDWYQNLAKGNFMRSMPYSGRLSLLYTYDFAEICLRMMQSEKIGLANASPYTISDGLVYDVKYLIEKVGEITGRPIGFRLNSTILASVINLSLAKGRFSYWRHAAFDPNYFVVDSSRFLESFPEVRFTPIEIALKQCFVS